MLVLTQKQGEILQIGDDVRIYIKRIRGHWVRLCIDAPPDVSITRIPLLRMEAETEQQELGEAGGEEGGAQGEPDRESSSSRSRLAVVHKLRA